MKFNRKNCEGMLALVTGADSGIGLCFCRALADRGVSLMMVSNRPEELARCAAGIAQRYGVDTHPCCIDLSTHDAAETLMDFIHVHDLRPSLLINNAGIFDFKAFADMSPKRIGIYCSLHIRTLTELTWLMANRWIADGTKGYILNMSSMSCWTPMPGISMYAASKAYIRVFSRSIGYELSDSGISVTVACPGGIATDLFGLPEHLKRFAVRIGVLQTPEKFVVKALRRTFRRRRQYINGWLNRFSIVFVGITPTPVRMLIKHRLLDRLNPGKTQSSPRSL